MNKLIVILCSFLVVNAMAQDPQFSQFYSAPIFMNPGFAGNTTQARFVLNYRNQWPAMPGQFVSYAASADYNLREMNSGLAFGIQHDRAGSAALRYTNVAVNYSYTLQLSRTFAVKPGIYFSYSFRDINRAELVFGDQLIFDNPVSGSAAQFSANPVRYPDLGLGGIAYQKNWYAGMALHHVNRPNQSLFDEQVRLPMRFSMHGGYRHIISENIKRKEISSMSLVAHYKAQAEWDQLDIGLYYRYRMVTSGIYYRGLPLKSNQYNQPNYDAITFLLGFEYNDFAMAYSYDLTISKLIPDSGGAHEISMIWELASKREKRKKSRMRNLIPCAEF